MNEIWHDLISLCMQRGKLDMLVVLHPSLHRDKSSVGERAAILRELRRKGWSIADIHGVCQMTKRGLRKVLGSRALKTRQHRSHPKTTKRRRTARHRRLAYPSDYVDHRVGARQLESKHQAVYPVWSGILQRCYDKDNPGYRCTERKDPGLLPLVKLFQVCRRRRTASIARVANPHRSQRTLHARELSLVRDQGTARTRYENKLNVAPFLLDDFVREFRCRCRSLPRFLAERFSCIC